MFVGDYGTTLRMTIVDQNNVVVDLTGATVVFRLYKPGGTTVDKTATVASPTTGVATYVVEAGVLNEAGRWRWQAIVTTGSSSWSSTIKTFDVEATL